MEIINPGADDGLPPVDWAAVTEKLDAGSVARIAKAWADDGWPAEPDESGTGITAPFNAPSQGPPFSRNWTRLRTTVSPNWTRLRTGAPLRQRPRPIRCVHAP